MVRENKAKTILKNGGIAIGTFISLTDPTVFEVLGRTGYDFIVMDDEHSHYDKSDIKAMILAAESRDIETAPLIRIREGSVGAIKNALDMGALGIQVPMVDTYEQTKAIIDSAYYPPVGHRGLGSGQHSIGYGFMDKMEFLKTANREVLTVLQAESVESIKNLDAILSIDEVEVIFVGATDLGCSMGADVMGNRRHPELVRVFNDAVKRIVAAGKVAGAAVGTEDEIKEVLDLGVRYLCVGPGDLAAIRSSARRTLDMVKGITAKY